MLKRFLNVCVVFCFFPFQLQAFTDIENNWYKDSINALQEQGVIQGFEDGTFLPNDTITRAEILKIIMNAANIELEEGTESCFPDVPVESWYAKYICTGVQLGITKGYENGNFDPQGTVTVLETLAFGVRTFGVDLSYLGEGKTWYQKYQAFAHQKNIIPKHSYTIDTLINRGRAADVIYRLQELQSGKNLNYLSSACNTEPSLKSGEYTINIGGIERKYLLYTPRNIEKGIPKGLIVAFHGRTNSNEEVRDYMKIGGGSYGSTNNQTDFIVAYPAGLGSGPYSWSQYENIEFFDAIITQISEGLCINRDTVFSVGHSLGSYMSNKVSCQRGGVLRVMVGVASDGFDTECSGPVSSLILHLLGDQLSPYSNGERAYHLKAEQNLCTDSVEKTQFGDIKNCEKRTSCSLGNTVIFCDSYTPYLNDPHSWPKDGSDDILDFLKNID